MVHLLILRWLLIGLKIGYKMSFHEHLENYLQNRDGGSKNKSMPTTSQTKQTAHQAIAAQQARAAKMAEHETKQLHERINGRCYLMSEALEVARKKEKPKPPDLERIEYIRALRKQLKTAH